MRELILAFTGAGISRASGIPTFEEQGDLRLKLSRQFFYTNRPEFNRVISQMQSVCKKAHPNDAHLALAEYNIPVITMNIDKLHKRAGTKHLINIHGELPNIVLYGDPAPLYEMAHNWVFQLRPGDIFLIIGVSFYTNISEQLRISAMGQGAHIEIINNNSEELVRTYLEANRDRMGSLNEFISREIEV